MKATNRKNSTLGKYLCELHSYKGAVFYCVIMYVLKEGKAMKKSKVILASGAIFCAALNLAACVYGPPNAYQEETTTTEVQETSEETEASESSEET